MQNSKRYKVTLTFFIAILGGITHAAELKDINADQQHRQQQRDDALEKQLQPIREVQTGLEKQLQSKSQLQYLMSHSENICFEIKKFILVGEDAREFTVALAYRGSIRHLI